MNRCPNVHKDGQKSYLVCPVNTLGVMGAGLALAVKKQFPDAAAVYHYTHSALRGGSTLLADDPQLGYNGILFAATKENWRDPSRMDWIDKIGKELRMWITGTDKHMFFYIPKIGAGLGGLDWDEVKNVLEHHIGGLDDCYAYIERA